MIFQMSRSNKKLWQILNLMIFTGNPWEAHIILLVWEQVHQQWNKIKDHHHQEHLNNHQLETKHSLQWITEAHQKWTHNKANTPYNNNLMNRYKLLHLRWIQSLNHFRNELISHKIQIILTLNQCEIG